MITDFDRFVSLCHNQDFAVKKMCDCIDNKNVEGFKYYFNEWHNVTSKLLHNKYNDCGHKLNDEIIQYAKNNCIEEYNIYYD